MFKISTLFFALTLSAGIATAAPGAKIPVTESGKTVVACRNRQCTAAYKTMTREFLYSKIGSLLENNIGKKVLFCDADPSTRTCNSDSLQFYVRAGVSNGIAEVRSARVLDSHMLPDLRTFQIILDYDVVLNNIRPECKAARATVSVISPEKVNMEVPGFECRFTKTGTTVLSSLYNIDYVDMDYGILGAYYTLGAGQTSKGGRVGYALMRFTETPNFGNEIYTAPVPVPAEEVAPATMEIKEEDISEPKGLDLSVLGNLDAPSPDVGEVMVRSNRE